MHFILPILCPLWRHISLLNPFSHRHLIPYFHLPLFSRSILIYLFLTVLCPLTQSYLIFANRKDIRKLDENFLYQTKRQNTSIIIDKLEDAVAIDFDIENQLIFWSDIGFESIRGLRLRDNHKFDIIVTGIVQPDGLACDWITKKIYWADSDTGRIEVALYNGSFRTVLFWENLDQPRAIALVPSEGLIFWSDWGDLPKIERASMDGNNITRQVIITENIVWPNGLTVDHDAKRLYWADAKISQISSADFDGKNRLMVSCGIVSHPFALTVHGSILYWTDWDTKDIHGCNKTSNVNKPALINTKMFTNSEDLISPMGICVFDSSRQPKSSSPCLVNNGNCSHLCMLSSVTPYYSCACSTGIKLMEDGKTCLTNPEKILLLARRSDLRRISLDTKDYTSVVLPIRGIKYATVMDYDPVEGRVYWADDELRVIKRAMLNGSHQETIISTEVHHPDGIAIDWIGRNIYWTDAGTDRIEVARLNGSSRTILFNEGLDKPRAIVVHPEQGLMFWSDWGENAKIERAALDGSERKVIVDTNITWPNGLAIDYQLSRIYWCDAKRDTIEMARFDGSERKEIWSDMNSHLFGFTVFDQWVYWSDWQRRSVERVHKLTGKNRETIIEQLPDLMGIKAVSVKHVPLHFFVENPCANNNGNCSHLCLNRLGNDRVCACPTGYELTSDQQTCIISEAYFLLLRKNDIRRTAFESKKFDVVPVAGLYSATDFDVNMVKGSVYWIDSKQNTISRSFINGSNSEPVVQLTSESPDSLVIDWIANNLYWTVKDLKRIEVARFDGSFRRVLYHDTKKIPHSLAIDPISGFLFWSDLSSNGKIEKSFLDGERIGTIAESVGHASSLTLDYAEKRLYWITNSSVIMSCFYNGSSKTILMQDSKSRPSSLVVYEDSLYFVDSTSQTIESVNKSDPNIRTTLKKSELLASTTDLFMYHLLYQKGWNFCTVNNGGCQHLCFAKPSKPKVNIADNVYCSCATHYRLADEQNCLPPETFLLFSQRNEITRFLFDSEQEKNDFQDVTLQISGSKHIKALTYDQYDHSIYWIDGKNFAIKRVFLNGSGFEVIVQSVNSDLLDIVIDPYSRILFWTSGKTNSINATRLIGHPTPIGSIYHSHADNPRFLAFHYRQNFLFWTNDLHNPQIERIALPSALKTTVVSDNLHEILAIAVDQEMDFLLWADKSSNKIEYSDLDGKHRMTLYEERNIHPIALTTLSKYLFWIEKDKKSIEKLPLDLNNGRNKQTIFTKLSSLSDIISVPLMKKNSSSLHCANENGGCSHICMIIHGTNTTEAKCGCPKGLVLSKDEKDCIEPIKCEPKQFSCSNGINCIDAIFRCNGSPDCLDGSDELNCPKCGSNQFTCFKDVISHEELICLDNDRICDGHKDCYDGHDELCCLDKFLCNSRHCLTSDQLCDGKKDCIDGEDEDMNSCQQYTPSKTSVETTKSYTLFVVAALGIVFILFVFYQCKRCLNSQTEKDVTDILMTEQRPNLAFSSGIRNNRSPHRKFSYNKKPLLNEKNKLENCNTLTSTTTVSGMDTIPNEAHLPLEGNVGLSFSHPLQSKLLMEPNIVPSSSSSSAPVSYPCETINPPPSPATERSQSTYSTYSSSLFVPRSRTRNSKNGVFSASKPSTSSRRHKKSRWHKSSLRGPPPTPCGTDVYEDLEATSVKYIFYDNAQTEIDDFDYKPPPPTPRHYFSDPSCPPSPVTEHSFCNLNLNPPPPSPVQESD